MNERELETSIDQHDRLKIGQNIYDQPAFEAVNTLGKKLDDLDGVRRWTSAVSAGLMNQLRKKSGDPDHNEGYAYINILDTLVAPDIEARFSKAVEYYKIDGMGGSLIHMKKGSEFRRIQNARGMLDALLINLEEPVWKLYYLFMHNHKYYKGNGEFNPTAKLAPDHFPLKYEEWVQNYTHEKSFIYEGLSGITNEMGYAQEVHRPGKSVANREKYHQIESANIDRKTE